MASMNRVGVRGIVGDFAVEDGDDSPRVLRDVGLVRHEHDGVAGRLQLAEERP